MKIYKELSLRYFEFWSGAIQNANQLTYDELDALEQILEMEYPDGVDETYINDLMWFEFDIICEWLSLELNDAGDIIREDE